LLAKLIKSHATVTASGFESMLGPASDDVGQLLSVKIESRSGLHAAAWTPSIAHRLD